MKIVSWNIMAQNRKYKSLINHIMEHDPDVICLQEVSAKALEELKNFSKYHLHSAIDAAEIPPRKVGNQYLCILTKDEMGKTLEFDYYNKPIKSIWSTLGDKILSAKLERPHGHFVDINHEGKKIRILNTRLSCVIGANDRMIQLDNFLNKINNKGVNIACGDFNIVESKLFNILSGWLRAYKLNDHFLDERKEAERIYKKYNLKNVFKGDNVHMLSKYSNVQFSHILVPNGVGVKRKKISNERHGSDHKMLYLEVDLD